MKNILSTKYSAGAFTFSMLFIRIVFGVFMLAKHGYTKMMNFETMQTQFYNFLGMGSRVSLILDIFAEVICPLFIVLGLFTRLAAIPLIISMLVVIFGANAGKPLLDSELGFVYLAAYTTLLLCGPGRISIDGMINK